MIIELPQYSFTKALTENVKLRNLFFGSF